MIRNLTGTKAVHRAGRRFPTLFDSLSFPGKIYAGRKQNALLIICSNHFFILNLLENNYFLFAYVKVERAVAGIMGICPYFENILPEFYLLFLARVSVRISMSR
jgi:hypothetical protein